MTGRWACVTGLGVLAMSGCFDPSVARDRPCTAAGRCPDGFSCIAGFCVRPGAPGSTDAATADARDPIPDLELTLESAQSPYPGILHEVYVDAAQPARVHLVEVDLTSQEIELVATKEIHRGTSPAAWAQSLNIDVAINGDLFDAATFRPAGLAVGDGDVWSATADDTVSGFVRFDHGAGFASANISPPEDVLATEDLPAGTDGVVSGRPLIVRAGLREPDFDCSDSRVLPCDVTARTAIAISTDQNTLWLAVAEADPPGAAGATASQVGELLSSRGAGHALLFAGGEATALYIQAEGGVVTAPSGETAVANHLGIKHQPLPPGQLTGFVRERDVFDDTANLDGVLVELDDGRSMTTAADGRYAFSDVAPRLACVTASKVGYRSETRCKQVVSGDVTFNSIALFPDSDFIDAGP